MAFRHYILDGHEPVAVSLETWAKWFDENEDERVVCQTEVKGAKVSTVFIGIAGPSGNYLFETQVFYEAGAISGSGTREYATWDEALAGHMAIVYLMTHGTP